MKATTTIKTRASLSNWFSKNLGDAMLASEAIASLENYFLTRYTDAKQPKDMAIFMRHESEGRLHCEVKVYFSPAAADIAKELNAEPCQKPYPNGLSLLAGAEEAWQTLFPSAEPRLP
ncbi:MAG: hypothetical protein P1U47_03250 [Zhongshania sp.]|uniref:hypothetical protein n=1 Tax=Zhongshania sp. TaxID=1971902 RepID=UPI00260298E3|nr:hypothetical protein [Zhongshania sp.]MDF1691364.1 hypothetical protein [Zhongshania sp.]